MQHAELPSASACVLNFSFEASIAAESGRKDSGGGGGMEQSILTFYTPAKQSLKGVYRNHAENRIHQQKSSCKRLTL